VCAIAIAVFVHKLPQRCLGNGKWIRRWWVGGLVDHGLGSKNQNEPLVIYGCKMRYWQNPRSAL